MYNKKYWGLGKAEKGVCLELQRGQVMKIKKGNKAIIKIMEGDTLKMENHQPNRKNREIRNTRYYR